MTAKKNDFGEATEATPPIHQELSNTTPVGGYEGDLCPDSEAIVRFLLNAPGADPTLEHHFLVCADCRIEIEALRNVIGRFDDCGDGPRPEAILDATAED